VSLTSVLVASLISCATTFGEGSATAPASGDSNWGLLIALLVFVVIPLGICIYTVRGAYKLKFVFYYNNVDLIASTATPFAGIAIALFAGEKAAPWIIGLVYLAVLAWNFVAGFKFNAEDKFGAACVGLSRCIIGVVIPALIVFKFIFRGAARREGESELSYTIRNEIESAKGLVLIALLGWFLKSLVNGEDVMYWRSQAGVGAAGREEQTEYGDAGTRTTGTGDGHVAEETESPYTVLGLAESASETEIKKHYRDLMLRYHPDRTAGLGKDLRALAEEMAKRVTVAYNQIRDERRFT
jgi:hypothetical protein